MSAVDDCTSTAVANPTPGKTNLRSKCQTARDSGLARALADWPTPSLAVIEIYNLIYCGWSHKKKYKAFMKKTKTKQGRQRSDLRLLCGSIHGWGGESRNVHPKFYT